MDSISETELDGWLGRMKNAGRGFKIRLCCIIGEVYNGVAGDNQVRDMMSRVTAKYKGCFQEVVVVEFLAKLFEDEVVFRFV